MVQRKLLTAHPGSIHGGEETPGVVPLSGRVPGRSLLVLPISEAWRRRNRGEIAKKGSVFEGFPRRRIYRRKGAARGATRGLGAPLARPAPRACHQGAWAPGGGPLAPLRFFRKVLLR